MMRAMDAAQAGRPVAGGRLGAAASLLAALAVALGAFGAHALRGRLDVAAMATFETAVRYQLVHALAAALAADRAGRPDSFGARAGALFMTGIVLFSGSLYVLALGGPRIAGAVTPLGGLAFMAGWLALGAGFLRGRRGSGS